MDFKRRSSDQVVAVWGPSGPEVECRSPSGDLDTWRLAGAEVMHGHVRADGVSFGETGFGRISPNVLKEIRRAMARRTITPGQAISRLLQASH